MGGVSDSSRRLPPWRRLPHCEVCGDPASRRTSCCSAALCDYCCGAHNEKRLKIAGGCGSEPTRNSWRYWLVVRLWKSYRRARFALMTPRQREELRRRQEAERLDQEKVAEIFREALGPVQPCSGVVPDIVLRG